MTLKSQWLQTEPALPEARATPTLISRLWTYQHERFPVFSHGLLIAAFSSSAVSFSFLLRGGRGWPALGGLVIAFLSSFFFFFQLRVADEWKDFAEDARWRPYRPVPRGLVSLGELAWLAVGGGLVQLTMALGKSWSLTILLTVVWMYLAFMTREFFVREWIVQRPFTYLWSHMLVIPLADFYATGCDWTQAGPKPPPGLLWFLLASFCNGVALEVGRKIRAPESEEEGVRTYSVVWGRQNATWVWLIALGGTMVCADAAALRIHFIGPVAAVLSLLFGLAVLLAGRLAKHPTPRRAKALETFTGLWTLILYFSLGLVPLFCAWITR